MASGIDAGNEIDAVTKAFVLFTSSCVVGLFLHYTPKGIFDPVLRKLESDIRKAKETACKNIEQEKETRDYNKTYCKLMPHYTGTVVSILEAHVAFIRSMLLVLPRVVCNNHKILQQFPV